ncbi:unnamed protein product [Calypogeia fissa]
MHESTVNDDVESNVTPVQEKHLLCCGWDLEIDRWPTINDVHFKATPPSKRRLIRNVLAMEEIKAGGRRSMLSNMHEWKQSQDDCDRSTT